MPVVTQTVLLIDDDAQFRASVTPALESYGLRVLHAGKGSIARALIAEEEPALLVVDGLLPDTNGITWIEEMRGEGCRTPIIFVSAFYRDLTTFRHLTHELDVAKVFHKPVATDRFAREVASTLSTPTSLTPAAQAPPQEPEEAVLFPDREERKDTREGQPSYPGFLPVAADKLTGAIRRVQAESERTSVVAEALRQAHDLHGVAESHGFSEVSEAAARIEEELRQLQRSGRLDWSTMFKSIDDVRTHAAAVAGEPIDLPRPSAAAPPAVTPAAAFFLHRSVPRDFVPTLLVLEDDPAMIAYLRSAFDEVLVHLRPTSGVEEALEVARRNPPTAVLIGWPLEDRDALRRFIQMFRSLSECNAVPVILLSVDDDPHTRGAAAQLGVNIFLPHPIDLVRLHHAVDTAIENARAPQPNIAVLRDSEAAKEIKAAGIDCSLYFGLEELLRELDVQCPDLVLIGSSVSAAQVPGILRMSSWDADCAFLCFDDSPLADDEAITKPLDRNGGWLVEVHREAERVARLRRKQLRCSQTGLLFRHGAVAILESGLSAAQRNAHTYSVGLVSAIGLKGADELTARRLRTHLGRLISARFRREDVRGRWDDDTFVVGFDGTSTRAVVEVVRRLLEEIDSQRERQPDELAMLSCAVGLASYPLDGDTVRSLILSAHERLETAIKEGPDALIWR